MSRVRHRREGDPPPKRKRRWLRRLAGGAFLSFVAVAALVAWLLLTTHGRDTLLARVVRLLPPDSLSWQRAEGVVYGPLTLYGVHYRHAGVDFTARRVMLDPSLVQLFGRRLRLDAMEVDDGTLDLPVDRTPKPPPRWPDVLPKFAMPFTLSVQMADVQGLRISREGAAVIAVGRAQGGVVLAPGSIEIDKLVASSDRGDFRVDGRIDANRSWATRVQASWQAPKAGALQDPAELRVVAGGDLDRFVLSLAGHAPDPLALRLTLANGHRIPDWSLSVRANRFEPQRLFALAPARADATDAATAAPWTIFFDAQGTGGRARASGRIAMGDRALGIAPSQLDYEDGIVSAHPLSLDLLDGQVQVTGHADLRRDAPTLDVDAQLASLRWRADPKAEPVQASGTLALKGNFDAWTTSGSLDLLRGREHARLALAGSGDRAQATIASLDAATPAGGMKASGHLRWSPGFAWSADAKLDRFDPGYLAPGFDGAVSAHVRGSGDSDASGRMSLQAAVDGLSGSLRKRALGGSGTFDWKPGDGHVDADLRIGGSHIRAKGRFGQSLDLAARFDPLRLDDLLPEARGSIAGQLAAKGTMPVPAMQGRLEGSGLQWRGYGAAHLALDGSIAANASEGSLRLDADGVAGIPAVDQLHLQLSGSPSRPRVTGVVAGSLGSLDLAADAERQGQAWNGRVATLHYTPTRGPAWTLAAPATFHREDHGALRLAESCLRSAAASICADADWPHRASLRARSLPLDLLDPWITRPYFDAHAYGVADIDAQLAADAHGRWNGRAQLRSGEGGIHLQPQLQHPLFGYTRLEAHAALEGERLQASASSDLIAGGTLQAHLATGLSPSSPMQGDVALDLRDITWVELFSTDIAAPKGRFGGQLELGGSLAHPSASGRLQLSDFQAELPALGVALTEGHVQIDADPQGAATISGSLRSGDGTLAIGGGLRWNDFDAPLTVTVKGQNVRAADTPELEASISPDLQLGYAGGTLSVRGKVEVPSAKLDLERLDSTVSPSPDVVVLDPRDTTHASPLKVDVDLQLALGADVKLKGFGLDGKLGGQLRVRRTPGSAMVASGALDVSGRYAAYGQQLQIERGRLSYNGGSFDDPVLDVLAQREFDEATVGVRVRGTALRPQTQIVSTPSMDPSNALAYLVIGRPLQSADATETKEVGAAAAALSVGSNLLAQKVGARLGLDQAGVSESRALGGEAFTVGKYLSPRVFVSYGVALAGTGEVLTLKYLLRKGFDISIESSQENRASVNWRIEK